MEPIVKNLESLWVAVSVLLQLPMSGMSILENSLELAIVIKRQKNRLFDKDAEGWAPKNEMDDELNKALEMFPVDQNQPMDFQMPDLSSVRRNRYG